MKIDFNRFAIRFIFNFSYHVNANYITNVWLQNVKILNQWIQILYLVILLQGDSGGPLVCNVTNKTVLVGVVSGNRMRRQQIGGLFTRVTSYYSYIKEQSSCCKVKISKWGLILISSAFLLRSMDFSHLLYVQ